MNNYDQDFILSPVRFAKSYIVIARAGDQVRIHTHRTPLPAEVYCDLNYIVKTAQATARWGDCVEPDKLGDGPYCYLVYTLGKAYLVGAVDFGDHEELDNDDIFVIDETWDFLGSIDEDDVGEANEFINGERSDQECATLYYLMTNHSEPFSKAIDKLDDCYCVNDTVLACATTAFDDAYLQDIPPSAAAYIDYQEYAHDLTCGGDMVEFDYNGSTWTCTNANQ